jgi:hypothetical protein
MTYDAFLSYASQDKTVADAMCHYLEQRDLRCWIAPRDVRPGEDYAAEIIEAIVASRALVVVFSANANASKHVKNEVERAVSHGIVVVPFRTEEVQPSKAMELFLGAKHWLDAMSAPMEDHFEKLAVHLQFLAGHDITKQSRDNLASFAKVHLQYLAGQDVSAPAVPPNTTAPPAAVDKSSPGLRFSKRSVIISAVVLALLLVVAAGIVMNRRTPPNGGDSPATQGSPAAQGAPATTASAAEPLHGSIDVLLWDPKDASRRGVSIRDASARPLHLSDQVRVKLAMNRPAYLYLLWIGGDGKVAPVHPWRPGDWHNRPEQEQPIDRLSLPRELDRAWPLSGGAGMETILLLARDTPLPASVDVERAVAGLQPQKMQNPESLVEFDRGHPVTESMDHSRGALFFDPQRIDEPVLQNQQLLEERLGRYFPFISAVSFANRGE